MAKRTHACSHILMHVCLAPLAQEKHCDAKLKNVDNYDLATFLRQRLAFLESEEGPYAISGAEMRRALSNHSWQLSHSFLLRALTSNTHRIVARKDTWPHAASAPKYFGVNNSSTCICSLSQLSEPAAATQRRRTSRGPRTLWPVMLLRLWILSCRWIPMLRGGLRCPTESYSQQVFSILSLTLAGSWTNHIESIYMTTMPLS